MKAVLAGGPAAAGGLKAGDRILTIDGRWTDTLGDAYVAAGFAKPGQAGDGRREAGRQGSQADGVPEARAVTACRIYPI